jgi:hypothetical protein
LRHGESDLGTSRTAVRVAGTFDLGAVATVTLHGCIVGKKFGCTDGWTFVGITIPISNCSA